MMLQVKNVFLLSCKDDVENEKKLLTTHFVTHQNITINIIIGEWSAKRIENPDYKGKWVHPEIDNPDFVEQKDVYKRGVVGGVGIEVWQVKSGTVFSDFVVTDSVEDAEKFFEERNVSKDDEEAAKNAFEDANSEDGESEETVDDLDDIEKDEL